MSYIEDKFVMFYFTTKLIQRTTRCKNLREIWGLLLLLLYKKNEKSVRKVYNRNERIDIEVFLF